MSDPSEDRSDAPSKAAAWRAKARAKRDVDDVMLQSMCRFLALSNQDKLSFLPPIQDAVTYMFNECGDRTSNPLFYYCNAVYELTRRHQVGTATDESNLVAEICCLIEVMIQTHDKYVFIWSLDKSTCGVSGPADRLWAVLTRLATLLLAARGWERGLPSIPFSETHWSGTRRADAKDQR